MPIPDGTKFHGVAASVETANRGSDVVNARRDAYTIGDIRQTSAVPFFVTAVPGGSLTYTDPANIIDVSWSGGTGTYEITIPTAAEAEYRYIRVVNDGTFPAGASHKVVILASGGGTIDGEVTGYEINKAYNGVTVWSNGTEWIVIQAKSH
jgi:hypothetical protein